MSSGKLVSVPRQTLTGTFSAPILNLSPLSSGFLFDLQRSFWIPNTASLWLVWSIQYFDGNRSPQNWIFVEFNPVTNVSFEYSVSTETSPFLSRTVEDRLLLAKIYVKRWVYAYSPSPANNVTERRNVVLGGIRAKEY